MRETNLRGKDARSFCNETGSPILVANYQLVFSPGANFFPIFKHFFGGGKVRGCMEGAPFTPGLTKVVTALRNNRNFAGNGVYYPKQHLAGFSPKLSNQQNCLFYANSYILN